MIGVNRAVLVTSATVAALFLTGCGYLADTAPVQAVAGSGPVRTVAEKAGAATEAPAPKAFVLESRRPVEGYIPVGVTPPDRKLKARDPKAVEDLRKELEATDRANDAKAKAP